MLNPALAAAILGVSAWRKLICNLIWQSVTWRPGKLRFLIGVKDQLPIRPTAIARKHGRLRGRAVRQIRTSVGLRPPFVAHPATVSYPDRRALLISSVAQHRCADPGSGAVGRNAQAPVGSARTDANISVGRYSSTAASTGGGLKNSDPAPANPSSVAHARPAADVSAPTAGLPSGYRYHGSRKQKRRAALTNQQR